MAKTKVPGGYIADGSIAVAHLHSSHGITTDNIAQLIKNIGSKNRNTSIIVTHEMKLVNEVANKVIMLYNGNIIFNGSPEELNASNDKYIRYFISGKRVDSWKLID